MKIENLPERPDIYINMSALLQSAIFIYKWMYIISNPNTACLKNQCTQAIKQFLQIGITF